MRPARPSVTTFTSTRWQPLAVTPCKFNNMKTLFSILIYACVAVTAMAQVLVPGPLTNNLPPGTGYSLLQANQVGTNCGVVVTNRADTILNSLAISSVGSARPVIDYNAEAYFISYSNYTGFNVDPSGNLVAASLTGNGSGITGLTAAQISGLNTNGVPLAVTRGLTLAGTATNILGVDGNVVVTNKLINSTNTAFVDCSKGNDATAIL